MKKLLFLLSALISFSSVQAGMISTEDMYAADMKEQLTLQLSKPELVTALQAEGISQEEAIHRINRLTPQELSALSHQLDELPAGGLEFFGTLLTLFAIVVVTDALGYTDLFPFVTKPDE